MALGPMPLVFAASLTCLTLAYVAFYNQYFAAMANQALQAAPAAAAADATRTHAEPSAHACPACPECSEAATPPAAPCVTTDEASSVEPEGGDPAWHVASTLGCGTIRSEAQGWMREVCVAPAGGFATRAASTAKGTDVPLPPTVELKVTIAKASLPSGKREASCQDSLRATLFCDDTRFAPSGYTETSCGQHLLTLTVPPVACEYRLELRVVHVDGEAMADPPFDMPFPTNIGGNDTLRYLGPFVVNTDANIPGTLAVRPNAAATSAFRYHALPKCTDTTGGYWVRAPMPDLAPFFPNTWDWRGDTCRYTLFSSDMLRNCLRQHKRRTLWMGESTLEAVKDAFFKHYRCDEACRQWPEVIHSGETTVDANTQWSLSGSCHGLDECLRRDQPWPLLTPDSGANMPNVFVVGEGANDMMRSSVESWRKNLKEFTDRLESAQWKGTLVWLTAPTRNYKSTGAERQCHCESDGRVERPQCKCGSLKGVRGQLAEPHPGAYAHMPLDELNAAHYEDVHEVTMPRFYNTFQRTREANRIAIEHFQNTLPPERFLYVDYHAITEGLDSMYCIDGVHYHCDKRDFVDRKFLSVPCRGLGNAVAANAVANAVCNVEGLYRG